MKVSLNWAQAFSNVDLKSLPTDELLKKIGLQLGAVEEVIDYGARFDSIVVGRVASCVDHPNADRLHVCRIDDGGVTQGVERGDDGYVQVVCGATNVREGLLVAWLPPGSTVPSSYDEKEPFVLGARELRGVVSNGMLASAKELGLGTEHDGILEIDRNVVPGVPFVSLYDLDDTIVDCENKMFTHRPDCFGILGVARELAGIQQQQFTSPDWYMTAPQFDQKNTLPLAVDVQTDLVPRFVAVALDSVAIAPSPMWLKSALVRVGLKPINNVVDVTNYVMHLTAQPLHAYDYDKVAARSGDVPTLVARLARSDEKLALLNGKTIELDDSSVVIATDTETIGLAGVMGGGDTEVDDSTSRIILEVATFDMYNIRRTSMKHGVFTDAVTRFNKGQSPLQNDRVLSYTLGLLAELTSAVQASSVYDIKQHDTTTNTLAVTAAFINDRLGSALSAQEISQLLRNVEFDTEVAEDVITVTVPFWRQDIELGEDIVEEIGRLYGFDKLPVELPRRSVEPVALDALLKFKGELRTIMAAGGANEILSYNFVHGNLLERVGQNPEEAFRLRNALSPELQYYRLSLTPSLLTFVQPNMKAGHNEFMIYELGKCHNKAYLNDEKLPEEFNVFAGVFAAKKSIGAPLYRARRYLDYVAQQCGIELQYSPIEDETAYPVSKPFNLTRSALVSVKGTDTYLGIIGEFREPVKKSLKLPDATAGFEIGLEELLQVKQDHTDYRPLSRYPGTSQDICFRVESSLSYVALETAIEASLLDVVTDTSVKLVDIYQSEDTSTKQITFRISMVDHTKTLTHDEATQIIKKVTDVVTQNLSATVV
ncbi:phenylalanine--tRNA ligase subunit beta [Pedobacter sp.]|nr:phenylalanine--tRNA ligase subunit beta [Candidatus Saccharibacteria bacterium]